MPPLIRAKCRKLTFVVCLALGAAMAACACLATPARLPTDRATLYVTKPFKKLALADAIAAGDVFMSLVGDGRTVTHVMLYLSNESQKMLDLSVPAGQVFVPADTSFQYMMVVQPARDVITPDSHGEFKLATVCISPKTVKPPAESSVYMVGQHPDPVHEAECMLIIDTAKDLDSSQAYDQVPVAPERRAQTIAQLAIWMSQGERSRNPGDKVTKKTIADDILRCAGKSRLSLNRAERQSFNEFVEKILTAVNLTRKETLKRSISAK